MRLIHATDRYSWLTIALHWTVVLLIVVTYACVELHDAVGKDSELGNTLKALHFSFGLTILAITLLRLPITFFSPTPRIYPLPPPWQVFLAKGMQLALYAFLVAVPLSGWLVLSSDSYRVAYFGWELPALMAPSEAMAALLDDIHETAGTCGYALIGAHAVAALFHHYVVGDTTLIRMWPPAWRRHQDD
ncbi:MAG TPA: cytochrome b [Burkholderiaceae bacterium]|nr:cytochrome b [Burkholderiaceae bacterium]